MASAVDLPVVPAAGADHGADHADEKQPDSTAAQVEALCRALTGRSRQIEDAGRLPGDVVQALREAGVFQMWLAAELGGQQPSPTPSPPA